MSRETIHDLVRSKLSHYNHMHRDIMSRETTHDLALLLKKSAQLLESLPEKELKINNFSELIDTVVDIIGKENERNQIAKRSVNVKKDTPKIIDNWKTDEELQNISREDLSYYLNDEKLFPTREALQIFAANRKILGITKRTTKQSIIDIIKNHYERSNMFRTMDNANRPSRE